MMHNFIEGHPLHIKISARSMLQDNDYSNLAILRKAIAEAEHIKDFPDLAKHKDLLEQLTQYTAQTMDKIQNNPHFLDALYAKYSVASKLVEDSNTEELVK